MIRKMYVRISCIFSTDTFPASVHLFRQPSLQQPSAFFGDSLRHPVRPRSVLPADLRPSSAAFRPSRFARRLSQPSLYGRSFVIGFVGAALSSTALCPRPLSSVVLVGAVLRHRFCVGESFVNSLMPPVPFSPDLVRAALCVGGLACAAFGRCGGVISPVRVSETRCRRAGARRRARSCACAASGSRRSSRVSGCGRWPGRRSSS